MKPVGGVTVSTLPGKSIYELLVRDLVWNIEATGESYH